MHMHAFAKGSPRQPFAGSRLGGAATRPGCLRAPLLLSLPRSAGQAIDSAVPPRTTPTTPTRAHPPALGSPRGLAESVASCLPSSCRSRASTCAQPTEKRSIPLFRGHAAAAGATWAARPCGERWWQWRGPLLTTSLLAPATMPSGLPRCMHHHLHHHLRHRRPPTNPPTHAPWRAPPAPPRPRRSRRPARPRARPARTSRPARARSCPCSSRPPGQSGRRGRSARTWASRAWSSAPCG